MGGRYYFLGGGTAGGNAILLNEPDVQKYKFLMAILNSNITPWFVRQTGSGFRGGYIAFERNYLLNLAIPTINEGDKRYNGIISCVDEMISLHKRRGDLKEGPEKQKIEKEIERTDEEINTLVYSLYGITEEERKIIEQK